MRQRIDGGRQPIRPVINAGGAESQCVDMRGTSPGGVINRRDRMRVGVDDRRRAVGRVVERGGDFQEGVDEARAGPAEYKQRPGGLLSSTAARRFKFTTQPRRIAPPRLATTRCSARERSGLALADFFDHTVVSSVTENGHRIYGFPRTTNLQ
jgi:hypothetical protein